MSYLPKNLSFLLLIYFAYPMSADLLLARRNFVHFYAVRAELALALAVALSACGGGGEQTGATDLYGVYEVIEGGMSETQVKAVIGAEPDARQPDGSQSQILTWEADPNTYRHITLLVTVHDKDGVSRKIITGHRGNKSQSY